MPTYRKADVQTDKTNIQTDNPSFGQKQTEQRPDKTDWYSLRWIEMTKPLSRWTERKGTTWRRWRHEGGDDMKAVTKWRRWRHEGGDDMKAVTTCRYENVLH